ncbi:MAG: S49 family peptidase [Candidatus Thermoplasmatota archaeon]|nr:S49 family peptidase [Candidatus Thermoplasmatota archaeon]
MPAFKSHSTATSDKPWDAGETEKRVRSGEKKSYYGLVYGWRDPQGKEGVKATYKFPHHEVAGDGTPGPANLNGCQAALNVLNGAMGGADIPDADRAGVHAHMARHPKDGGKEVAPLKRQAAREHPLVFDAFQDKAWALHQSKLDEIIAVVETRLEGKDGAWEAASKSGNRADDPSYDIRDGVAVIPVFGVLDKRMNLFSRMSGGTSYELLTQALREALADPQVQAVLFDIDSPGGAVDGIKTLADQIYAARGSKPLVAFGSGYMASGAYWLGSAADQVLADDTANVGSIGVTMTHFDRSGQDAQRGIKRTHIYSGKYKVAGTDAGPLSAADQAYLQEMSDQYYQMFLEAVGQNRGKNPEQVHAAMGDGRIFIGQKAQEAGLVDQIGTFDDALLMAKSMASKKPGQGRKSMDRATLESQHPELFAEVKGLGAAEAKEAAAQETEKFRAEGQAAERQRVVEMLEYGGDPAITLEAVREGKTFAEMVKVDRKAEKEGRAQALQDLQSQATGPLGQQAGGGGAAGGDDFEAKVKQLMETKNLSRAKAIVQAAQDHPDLHADYIARCNQVKK